VAPPTTFNDACLRLFGGSLSPLAFASLTIQRSSLRDFRGQVFEHRGQLRGQVRGNYGPHYMIVQERTDIA